MRKVLLILMMLVFVVGCTASTSTDNAPIVFCSDCGHVHCCEAGEVDKTTDTDMGIIDPYDSLIFAMDEPDEKPYIHKNPNTNNWMCSVHGELDSDSWVAPFVSFFEGQQSYCIKCISEILDKILSEHIVGIEK